MRQPNLVKGRSVGNRGDSKSGHRGIVRQSAQSTTLISRSTTGSSGRTASITGTRGAIAMSARSVAILMVNGTRRIAPITA
jgi:hypothetical protein